MTGSELRAARKALGMTQVELGQALGYGEKTVRGWEMSPTVPTIVELAMTGLRAADEIDELCTNVIAFGGPAMVAYARDWGLPPGHLHPKHYDILKRAGARMVDFTRGSQT